MIDGQPLASFQPFIDTAAHSGEADGVTRTLTGMPFTAINSDLRVLYRRASLRHLDRVRPGALGRGLQIHFCPAGASAQGHGTNPHALPATRYQHLVPGASAGANRSKHAMRSHSPCYRCAESELLLRAVEGHTVCTDTVAAQTAATGVFVTCSRCRRLRSSAKRSQNAAPRWVRFYDGFAADRSLRPSSATTHALAATRAL